MLAHLRRLDVRLSVVGERLRCDAPRGVLTPELRTALARHKAELLKLLRAPDAPRGTTLTPIPRALRDRPLPMSFGQERLWFLAQLDPQSSAYNVPASRRWQGTLDTAVLQRCLDEIVRRHETLRTTLASVDGEPAQIVHPPTAIPLPVVDLQDIAEEERESAADRLAREEAQRPFDLGRGPLLRASLIRLTAEDHLLLLTMHHAITDGWSLDVFAEELETLYAAFSRGQSSPLPELPVQYADFAQWQRTRLSDAVVEAQLAFWRRHLGPPLPTLNLPTDRPRPAVQSFRGRTHPFQLSPSVTEDATRLGNMERATPFMVLLAGFAGLLHRYTGQDDIVIGAAVANRSRAELEPLIGFFVNTIALRTDLSGQPTFRQLVRRVREATSEAYAHQDVPFEKVVEVLHPERRLSDNPLFRVAFILQDGTSSGVEFDVESVGAPFDLTLLLWTGAAGLEGRFQYATDLFDANTIARMAGHLDLLLSGWAREPDRPVAELPMLTVAERRQLLTEWNATGRPYPTDWTIPQLFEVQASRTPDAVAVVFGDAVLTYRELSRRADQLAHYLRGHGVGPEVVVGLCVERSLGLVVALLGVLKAGGAYLPLDPAHPSERLGFMLAEAEAPVLVTQRSLLDRFPVHGAKVVCLDRDWDEMGPSPGDEPDPGVTAGTLAYLIYTSGSTGQPKGVEIPHQAVINLLCAMQELLQLSERDAWLSVTTLSFDIAVLELMLPLTVGARVVVMEPEGVADPSQLADRLTSAAITVMQATPTTWRLLIEYGWQGHPGLTILCGGETLSPGLAGALLERAARVWNVYGPTETTVWSTAFRVEPTQGPVPIGRPIANIEVYVLDRQGEPVPIGVPGELYIGGSGVARGYFRRPELTRERFLAYPLGGRPDVRIYRTGDRVRFRSDGNLEFLGRLDDQVKVRGYRVEPGEIEAVLSQHPAVQEAVVIAEPEPDASGDKRLCAYVGASREGRPSSGELREFVARKLPGYMIPSAFVLLEQLPLTANGKVDRHALSAMTTRGPIPAGSDSKSRGPSDHLERELVRIWESTLGTSPIGMGDNFFELGGTSLRAVALLARIEETFREPLPLATLFQTPTVEGLARAIREQGWSLQGSGLVPIRRDGAGLPIFAVPGIGGDSVTYVDLARHLGAEQPFYGLQARGLDGRDTPFTRLPDMATHYLAQVRAQQAHGPYALLGTCMGGVVAFEMAQQLRAQGEEVKLLALIDSWPPVQAGRWHVTLPTSRSLALLRFLVGRVHLHLQALAALGAKERRAYLGRKARTIGRKLIRRDPLRGNWSEIHQDRVRQANYWALQQYVPRPYAGRIMLFVAANREVLEIEDDRLAWRDLAVGGLEVYSVPGHDSGLMLRAPNVRILSAHLRDCLRRANAPDGPAASASVPV
jgi:amino acid adenylation domain-containing protein